MDLTPQSRMEKYPKESEISRNYYKKIYSESEDYPTADKEPKVKYMIASLPRTGSNYLCNLLWSRNNLGKPAEYFNIARMTRKEFVPHAYNDISFLDNLFKHRTSPNGVFAVKAFITDLAQLSRQSPKALIRLGSVRVAFLRRHNKEAQALSLARAWHDGVWYREAHRNVDGINIPRNLVNESLAKIDIWESRWLHLFERTGTEPMMLWYEDLVSNPQTQIAKIHACVMTRELR